MKYLKVLHWQIEVIQTLMLKIVILKLILLPKKCDEKRKIENSTQR